MTPEERKEFQDMQRELAELRKWKEEREKNQLTFPLDNSSVKAITEALRTTVLDRINVVDIFFQATRESPTEEGQMRFFNDRSTQTFRCTTTKGVFTGTIDLTAV